MAYQYQNFRPSFYAIRGTQTHTHRHKHKHSHTLTHTNTHSDLILLWSPRGPLKWSLVGNLLECHPLSKSLLLAKTDKQGQIPTETHIHSLRQVKKCTIVQVHSRHESTHSRCTLSRMHGARSHAITLINDALMLFFKKLKFYVKH